MAQTRPEGAKQTTEAETARHRAEPAERSAVTRPAPKGKRARSGAGVPSKGKRAAVVVTAFAVLLGVGAAGQASGTATQTTAAAKASVQSLDLERLGSYTPALPAPASIEAKPAESKPAEAPAPAAPAAAPAPAAPPAPAPAAAPAPVQPVAVDDPAGAQAYAAAQLPVHGWAASEMQCLQKLWTRESDWKTTATNASSGAYGVVQSLPAEKMASAGADYLTNYRTQINWGLQYVQQRYGSPCGALNFHYANNWY
ncbi:MAG: hypothetical protein NTU93_10310 [Arthrobacter sp.]|nr:hypothetical protein [Arthrobacter sp.]